MAKLAISLQAQADAAAIIRYLAQKAGRPVAEKYVAAFDQLFMRLIGFPESGAGIPVLSGMLFWT